MSLGRWTARYEDTNVRMRRKRGGTAGGPSLGIRVGAGSAATVSLLGVSGGGGIYGSAGGGSGRGRGRGGVGTGGGIGGPAAGGVGVMKLVQEHYLREDIKCGSALCYACYTHLPRHDPLLFGDVLPCQLLPRELL
ncbi:unnamed protein product [Closterium sp. Naga37s-1]|nr:unnamed protein product [Closterium sp. Naga37s-1]